MCPKYRKLHIHKKLLSERWIVRDGRLAFLRVWNKNVTKKLAYLEQYSYLCIVIMTNKFFKIMNGIINFKIE